MNFFKKIKVEYERFCFRRGVKKDAKIQLRYIAKAERLSKKRKCRLWVVRTQPGEYIIRTKADLKAALRSIGIKGKVDIFVPSDIIIHITK